MKQVQDINIERPDVQRIMADIRAKVRSEIAASAGQIEKQRPLPSYVADVNGAASHQAGGRRAGDLLVSEELRYLNSHYAYSARIDPASIESHRSGLIGRFIIRFKRKLLSMLRDSLLRDYLQSERDFQAHLVRFLNDVSKYIDARDAASFWELIRKIDYDSGKAMERIERIAEEQQATMSSSEKRVMLELTESLKEMGLLIAELSARVSGFDARVRTVEGVTGDLKAVVGAKGDIISKGITENAKGASGPQRARAMTQSPQVLLENQFYPLLGDETAGYQDYVNRILSVQAAGKPLLEIGCGRGGFLSYAGKKGIPAYGLELDETCAHIARSSGLKVECVDAIKHLEQLPDGALCAVVALHGLESVSFSSLRRVFDLCALKLMAGGLVVLEAINPESVSGLTAEFFRSPEYHWPIHPDTMAHALRLSGLTVVETHMLSLISQEKQLKSLQLNSDLLPRWTELVRTMNENIRNLNDILYGPRRYCVIAVA